MRKVDEACDGVDFESNSSNPIDPIIKSLSKQRGDGEKFKEVAEDRDYIDYGKSLLLFCIPWAVLFVLSLIALYFSLIIVAR